MANDDWRITDRGRGGGRAGLARPAHGRRRATQARELADELEAAAPRRLARRRHGLRLRGLSRAAAEQAHARRRGRAPRSTGSRRARAGVEHWLDDEDRWDDEPPGETWEEEELDRGFAPWEVRVECASRQAARELAEQLETEGYRLERRSQYVIVGAASREDADALATAPPRRGRAGRRARLGGRAVEPVRHLRRPGHVASSHSTLTSPANARVSLSSCAARAGEFRAERVSLDGVAAPTACCAYARSDPAADRPTGGGRPGSRRSPPRRSLGRRAVPPRRRGPGRRRSRRARPAAARSTTRSPRWTPAWPQPSSKWKVRYALLLGLERVLSEPEPPHLASGTELRRHQVDALAGMLTELIAASQKPARTATGTATASARPRSSSAGRRGRGRGLDARRRDRGRRSCPSRCRPERPGRRPPLPLPPPDRVRQDDRRRRLRRGGAHRGRPDPHAPPPARRPVPPRADRPRLRRRASPTRSSRAQPQPRSRTRSRSRPTPGSRGTSTRSPATRTSS